MTMQRARHVALAVLVLGGLVLSGCGRERPGTAAYVGTVRYTESQVERIVTEATDAASDAAAAFAESKADQADRQQAADAARTTVRERIDTARLRQSVVSWLVLIDLGRRIAAERSVALPVPDEEGAPIEDTGLAPGTLQPGTRALRLFAEWSTVSDALLRQVSPQPEPATDAELASILDGFRWLKDDRAELTVNDLRAQMAIAPQLNRLVALRKLFAEAAQKHHVEVNPRYRPLVAQVAGVPLTLSVGGGTTADLAASPSAA
jgi:hypothetical protein